VPDATSLWLVQRSEFELTALKTFALLQCTILAARALDFLQLEMSFDERSPTTRPHRGRRCQRRLKLHTFGD
jgi:hypothetical protein